MASNKKKVAEEKDLEKGGRKFSCFSNEMMLFNDSVVSDIYSDPQSKSNLFDFNKSGMINYAQDVSVNQSKRLQSPKPDLTFTNNVICQSDNFIDEEHKECHFNETQADMLLAARSFNHKAYNDTNSIFLTEQGSDGKLLPLKTRKAEDNQQLYLQKYGSYIHLPSMYVIDSQICNRFPDYCIQLAKVVLPGEEDHLVNSHFLNGSCQIRTFQQLEEKYSKGLILRLIRREKSQLVLLKEVVLDDIWRAFIKFSECGNIFTLIIPNDEKHDVPEQIRYIKLHKSSTIHDVLNKMQSAQYKVHLINSPQQSMRGQNERERSASLQSSMMILGNDNNTHRQQNENTKQDISFVEEIIFDQSLRYIIGYGKKKFLLFNMLTNESKIHQIDNGKYEQICDMAFNSTQNGQFTCCVALKRRVVNQIVVFDFFENKKMVRFEQGIPEEPLNKSQFVESQPQIRLYLNFAHKPTPLQKVKISFDFRTVVFTDIEEKFIVEQKDGYTVQRKLNQLTGKIVHYIFQDKREGSSFYFIQSKDYDGSLKISHSHREKKLFKINRNIEPGILKVFDFNIQLNDSDIDIANNQNFIKKSFRIIGMQDEDFTFDKIYIDEKPENVENPANQVFLYRNVKVQSFIFSYMRAQSTSWPYFAYSGFSNYLLLIDAFQRKFIQRIQLADNSENITICDTYITDTYDLFVLTLNSGQYKLYMVDLDRANLSEQRDDQIDHQVSQYCIGDPVFTYRDDDVQHRSFISLHVRGSSRKEVLDRNEKQFVYFLHEGGLYYWVHLNQESAFDKIKLVSNTTANQFHIIKDGIFVFLKDIKDSDGKLVEQQILRLQTNFSQYQMNVAIKRISDSKDKIVALLMDQITNYIVFVTQTKEVTAESDLNITKLKIFDLNEGQNKTIFEIPLQNEKLIGRLKSGLCTLINGHIYFNNNLVKIRYDLIKDQMNYKFDEEQIFDFYSGIFKLEPNIMIRTRTPLKSIRYHRVVYITKDLNHEKTQTIMILPFLHEKRVYLNRIKLNTYYFYSSIETPLKTIEDFNAKIRKDIEGSLSKESKSFEYRKKMKTLKTIDNSLRDKTLQKADKPSNMSIICMNLTENKYYVYGTDGVLENRIDYEEQGNLYGTPIGTSSSGQYFIFRNTLHEIEDLKFLTDEQRIERFMTVNILKLTIFSFEKVKEINLYKNIKEYLLQQNDREKLKKLSWLYNLKFSEINEVDFQYVVNDKVDVCVRIIRKTSDEYDEEGERLDRHQIEINLPDHQQRFSTIYYFENGNYTNGDPSQKNGEVMQSMFVTNQHGGFDYLINKLNLFFWSDHTIKYCYLKDGIEDESLFTLVNFRQDNLERFSYFKDLRTSSDPNMFVFIVHQSPGNNSIFTWFTKENAEAEAYDVNDEYELLWDKLGNLYIITDNKVIFNRQRCSIKAYDFQELLEENHKFVYPNTVLSNKRGHRFDYKGHNWLIYREYISLPFSYLTFMIKSKIEKKDPQLKTNYFDPVPYDYIFNKGTSFTDGDFVKKDSKQVERVLQNFERIDPGLLELLIYNQNMVIAQKDPDDPKYWKHIPAGSNTPLYMAVQENNNRSVDIILKYMTKINFNSSRNFMNVFPSLVNYQNFIQYLQNLPIQTALMKQKQVLRVNETYNNNIVKICESPCVNIDDKFYMQMMEEQEITASEYKSYPVKVVAFRFAWLLLNPEGKMFLEAIFKNENLIYYRMPTMQMIIEFLYLKYKDVLLTKLLPVFMLQAIFFQAMVYLFEGYYTVYSNNAFMEDGVKYYQGTRDLLPYKIFGFLLLILNIGMAAIQIHFQYQSIKNMGLAYLYRFYSIIDIIYISLIVIVFMICAYQLVTDYMKFTYEEFRRFTRVQRNLETVCVFFIYMKAGYFLSLIESIAPLMDNISQVVLSIKTFMGLLMMYIFAFASCFFLLGRNQLYFDNISDEEMNRVGIPYDTFSHSIWYVYFNYMMGGKFYKSFDLGESSQSGFLYFLFIVASCYIDIILLKMLIAIMGSTFASRKLVAEEVKVKDHLRFLLDNWHLMDYALKDKSQVAYIISAFSNEQAKETDQGIKNLQNRLDELDLMQQNNFKKLQYDITQVNLVVQTLMKENESDRKSRIKDQMQQRMQGLKKLKTTIDMPKLLVQAQQNS